MTRPPYRSTADEHAPPATRGQRVALLAGLLVVGWFVLQWFASILLPFVAAAGVAYFLDPLAARLDRMGLRRPVGSLLLIAALLTSALLFVLLLYPLILSQIGILLGRVPTYAQQVQRVAEELIASLQERLGQDFVDSKLRDLVGGQAGAVLSFLINTFTRLIGGGFALFNVLSLVVVTPVVAFYLLRDWPAVVAKVDSWLPYRYAGVLRAQAREVDRILSAWLRGQALCCLFLALFYATGLQLVGLDLGLIVGISAGALSFIPYVGSITGLLVSVGLALAQFPDWTGVVMVLGVFIVGNLLEGYVIYPRFLGDRVELHAVWVIFALFAGGAGFGFVGVLLAVPVAAIIGVLCRFWLRRYLQSPLYLDPPDLPAPERQVGGRPVP
jgi:predicted PurR-regulated permease PerM